MLLFCVKIDIRSNRFGSRICGVRSSLLLITFLKVYLRIRAIVGCPVSYLNTISLDIYFRAKYRHVGVSQSDCDRFCRILIADIDSPENDGNHSKPQTVDGEINSKTCLR